LPEQSGGVFFSGDVNDLLDQISLF